MSARLSRIVSRGYDAVPGPGDCRVSRDSGKGFVALVRPFYRTGDDRGRRTIWRTIVGR